MSDNTASFALDIDALIALIDEVDADDAFDGPLTEEIARYDADPTGGDACRY